VLTDKPVLFSPRRLGNQINFLCHIAQEDEEAMPGKEDSLAI
jgi:hypothetical protein